MPCAPLSLRQPLSPLLPSPSSADRGGYDRGGYDRGGGGGYDRPSYDRPRAPAPSSSAGRTDYRVIVTGMHPSTSWQDLKDFARQVGQVRS
jgi:hypothetical protein